MYTKIGKALVFPHPSIAFMSFFTIAAPLIGVRRYLSTSTCSTLGVTKAGRLGPMRMFWTLRCSRVSNTCNG